MVLFRVGVQGSSLPLMRIRNQGLAVGLCTGTASTVSGGVPGVPGPLERCALMYMDDYLVHSPTQER